MFPIEALYVAMTVRELNRGLGYCQKAALKYQFTIVWATFDLAVVEAVVSSLTIQATTVEFFELVELAFLGAGSNPTIIEEVVLSLTTKAATVEIAFLGAGSGQSLLGLVASSYFSSRAEVRLMTFALV